MKNVRYLQTLERRNAKTTRREVDAAENTLKRKANTNKAEITKKVDYLQNDIVKPKLNAIKKTLKQS